jgi:hypothetical protein
MRQIAKALLLLYPVKKTALSRTEMAFLVILSYWTSLVVEICMLARCCLFVRFVRLVGHNSAVSSNVMII